MLLCIAGVLEGDDSSVGSIVANENWEEARVR